MPGFESPQTLLLDDNNNDLSDDLAAINPPAPDDDVNGGEISAQRSETLPPPDVPEAPSDKVEYVDTFTDSLGIERSPERPLVKLTPEAQQAVDDFFVEHHHYADSIQKVTEATGDLLLAQAGQQVDGKFAILRSITSPAYLQQRLTGQMANRTGSAAEQQDAHEPTELETVTQEVTRARSLLDILPQSIGSTDYKDIKSFLDSLPPDVSSRFEGIGAMSLKSRFSRSQREQSVDMINQALSSIRHEAEFISKDERIVRVLAKGMISALQESSDGVTPYHPDEGLSEWDRTNPDRILQNRNDISRDNTPTQNESVLTELLPEIELLTEQFSLMQGVENATFSSLLTAESLAAIAALSPTGYNSLAQKLSETVDKAIKYDPELADVNQLRQGFLEALDRSQIITRASIERIDSAISTVFEEQALPKLYINSHETDRATELAEAFNKIRPDRPINVDSLLKRVKKWNFTPEAGSKVLFHATPYALEMMRDGLLKTKQRQIDDGGVLHEHMQPAHDYGETLTTHSSVPHLAEGYALGYTGDVSRAENSQGVSGVFLIPLSRIIKTAPYDSNGMRLVELPLADGATPPYISGARPADGMHDDFVFYSSPLEDEKDDYAISLEGSAVVLAAKTGQVLDIPPSFDGRVELVESFEPHTIGQPIYDLYEKIRRETGNTVIVPLRQAPVEYVAEVPRASMNRPNRFRQHSGLTRLEVSTPVRRRHALEPGFER